MNYRHFYRRIFLLFLFYIITFHSVFSQKDLLFKHLSIDDGLSNSPVRSIIQDTTGYIWMGTLDGLNRYNGYEFKVYRNDKNDSTSLSDNAIEDLVIDKNGSLWVATYKGLNRYREEFDDFIVYLPDPEDTNSLQSNGVTMLYVDKNEDLWVCTWAGLHKYNYASDNFTYYPLHNDSLTSGEKAVGMIQAYHDHYIVGTHHSGLFHFYPDKKQFIPFQIFETHQLHIGKIEADMDSNLWISATDHGLFKVDPIGNVYQYSTKNLLPENMINDIYIHEDIIYLGFRSEGLAMLDYKNNSISYLNVNGSITEKHSFFKSVHLIHRTKNNFLWIGSSFGGVHYHDPNSSNFKKYDSENRIIQGLLDKNINTIEQINDSILWLGTSFGGIQELNLITGIYKYIHKESDYYPGLPSNFVRCILNLPEQIYLGTQNGLYLADKKTRQIRSLKLHSNIETFQKDIISVVQDNNNSEHVWITASSLLAVVNTKYNEIVWQTSRLDRFGSNFNHVLTADTVIWVASQMGIHRLNRNYQLKKTYTLENKTSYFENQRISALFKSSDDSLYIATAEGLMIYLQDKDIFIRHKLNNKLPSPYIYGIEEDDKKTLWLSTSSGLSAYNPISGKHKAYTTQDGLQSNMFISRSSERLTSGKMAFGGINGLNLFNPELIFNEQNPSVILISGFRVFNQSIKPKTSSLVNKEIHLTRNIKLSHKQHSFTFEFTGLNYTAPKSCRYKYRLNGFNDNWSEPQSERTANYTNIPPGKYVFEVLASNHDDIWTTSPARLSIIITPPFYQKFWFKLFLILIMFLLVLTTIHLRTSIYRRNQIKLETMVEERTLEIKRQSEKIAELNSQRFKFFTNISHEIRTPLLLITGPLEKLKKVANDNEESTKYLDYIDRNTKRLLKLINQLLDFRKIEHEHYAVNLLPVSLQGIIVPVVQNFKALSENEGKFFTNSTLNFPDHPILTDADKIEKILYNLLSNAFKYCGEPGNINLEIYYHSQNKNLNIKIENDGVGISEENRENLFSRFKQLNNNFGWKPGSGIGLEYTKKLVTALSGEITYINSNGKNIFEVHIPLQDFDLNVNQFEDLSLDAQINQSFGLVIKPKKNIRIALIEDDQDVRNYMLDILSSYYTVHYYENGNDAIEGISESKPDLVLSDIIIPYLDGVQICQKIKSSEKLKDIPVILVTSLSEPEHVAKGTFAGADGYIFKPFTEDLLLAKIHTVLENKDRLKETYQKKISLETTPNTNLSEKELFLRDLLRVIEANMHLPAFGAGDLAKKLNMSRGTLYNKLNEYLDQPVKELINELRFKKALGLLKDKDITIAEIAYQVGFNDVKHFSRLFKKKFGQSPSAYRK